MINSKTTHCSLVGGNNLLFSSDANSSSTSGSTSTGGRSGYSIKEEISPMIHLQTNSNRMVGVSGNFEAENTTRKAVSTVSQHMVDLKVKNDGASGQNISTLFSRNSMKSTEMYEQVMSIERPLAIAIYILYLLLSPLVFRYSMVSDYVNTLKFINIPVTGNATLAMTTDWAACSKCIGYNGITLSKINVLVSNVTFSNYVAGFPSISLFASNDFVNWFNIYSPPTVSEPYISNFGDNFFAINQTNGEACLGAVYQTYIVACLTQEGLANTLTKGQAIQGPPFNNRCSQVAGICGVPCADLSAGDSYPQYCDSGVINMADLVSSVPILTTEGSAETLSWANGLDWMDWLIVLTLFLDTLANILRFLPILSGRPTELGSAKDIIVSGDAVLCNATPIVAENESILLRGLIGRSATVFHTIGNRHSIRGLYVDCIVNEFRGVGEEKRLFMWLAWIDFLEMLVSIRTKDMLWPNRLQRNSVGAGDDGLASSGVAGVGVASYRSNALILETKDGTIRENHETKVSDRRTLRISRRLAIEYSCGLSTVAFDGVTVDNHHSMLDQFQSLIEAFESDRGGGDSSPIFENADQRIGTSSPNSHRSSNITDIEHGFSELFAIAEEDCLKVNVADMLPAICFLDGWLEEVKHHDRIYNYKDKTEAMKAIFNDAPCNKYFEGSILVRVQEKLRSLYQVFNGDLAFDIPENLKSKVVSSTDPQNGIDCGQYIHRDNISEIKWTLVRSGLPDFQVVWTYLSRSRLNRNQPAGSTHEGGCELVLETTRIKKGAIVFLKPPRDVSYYEGLEKWKSARITTYKVVGVRKEGYDHMVTLIQWPRTSGDDLSAIDKDFIERPMTALELIEKNRGKAGAMNVALSYLRHRTKNWCAVHNVAFPVQQFFGVVDARHMIAEPHIFWNEALPFFARGGSGKYAKDFGDSSAPCILVQYPQYFSNVQKEDYLDNKNSGYYVIWQTLRDCAKVITSSGTNAIWECTDPSFSVATTSRIEDTGTSQKYISKHISVHVPCFVAFGIAKDTEDYIEAVYRWSTGAVELFWSTLFSSQFTDFCVVLFIAICFAVASFLPDNRYYFAWLGLFFFGGVVGYFEKSAGVRPLRRLNASVVIVMNTMYWISNLLSLVWVGLVPLLIAFLSRAPLAATTAQAMTWAFVALVLRVPPAILTDRIINMAKFLSPKTAGNDFNFSMVLWRSSQLFVCSFGYTLLSVVSGTYTAFKAKYFDCDNTMWSSFRIKSEDVSKAWGAIFESHSSCFSFLLDLLAFLHLYVLRILVSFTMPDVLTMFLASFLLLFQLACIVVSAAFTNYNDSYYVLITMIVCGLNTFLVIDIALLLAPVLTSIFGSPIRPEYAFAILAIVVIGSLIYNSDYPLSPLEYLFGW